VDPSKPYTITGAPRVAKGKVYIGNGGAEYGVRGYVSAYDANDGRLVWRFYTVPGDPEKSDGAASDAVLREKAEPTWSGTSYWQFGGGGTVWDAIVYDPELDQLYIGTGNGSPWNRQIRSEGKGDNLFLSSILALDPDSGAYLWHYQETPGETWDFTAAQQISLATLSVGGAERMVILHAPKNGFFYVIDRKTGKLLSAEKFVPVNWAERIDLDTGRPVEDPGARLTDAPFVATSGAAGAHNWHSMAYSQRTGLVYIPAQQIPFIYATDQKFEFRPGHWNLGVDLLGQPLPRTEEGRTLVRNSLQGRLLAWDPVAQKEIWRVEYDRPWNGGVLATAGDLVFQGTATGEFRAYAASDGELLWRFTAQQAIIAGPVSFSVAGVQFIAVMAGNGGGLPLTLPAFDGPQPNPGGRILAFKLGGTARLPDFTPAVRPPILLEESWPEAIVEKGRLLYATHCSACHGIETLSAGVVSDLRRSALLADQQAWRQVTNGGVLTDSGMVSFSSSLNPDQAESIRAYVAREAALLSET
jgi:alcohol dehydrogenase (cytochrome c)/quinohemoprotein ethanol dehydrogenase